MKMKSAATLINVSHALGIGMPFVLHFSGALMTRDAFFLSAILCAAIAVATSQLWSGLIAGAKVLAADVPFEKHAGLSSAGLICFGSLWFIPTRSLLPVSDAIWATSAKQHGQTVRTALVASSDPIHYVVGALALGGLYVGISGDFGITLSRLASVIGGRSSIQAVLIGVAAWISVVFLFNGFFRAFLRIRGDA